MGKQITSDGVKIIIQAETRPMQRALTKLAKDQERFAQKMTGEMRKVSSKTEGYNNRMARSFGILRKSMRLVSLAAGAYLISWIGTAIRRIVALQRHINNLIGHFITFRNRMQVAFREFPVEKALAYVDNLVKTLGLDLAATRESFAKFAVAAGTAGLTLKEVQQVFESISKAIRVHNLGAEDTRYIFLALEQMASKGKVSYEELRRQLGERLPGAIKIAADAMGVTQQRLDEMLRNGELYSREFLPKFAAQVEKVYARQLPEAVKTATAEITRMKNEWRRAIEIFTGEEIEEAIGRMAKAMGNFLRQIRGVVDGLAAIYTGITNITAAMLEGVNSRLQEFDGNFQTNIEQATGADFVGDSDDKDMNLRGVAHAMKRFNYVLDKGTEAQQKMRDSYITAFRENKIDEAQFKMQMVYLHNQILATNPYNAPKRTGGRGHIELDGDDQKGIVIDTAPFRKNLPVGKPYDTDDPRGAQIKPTHSDWVDTHEARSIEALKNPYADGSADWLNILAERDEQWTDAMIAAAEEGHKRLEEAEKRSQEYRQVQRELESQRQELAARLAKKHAAALKKAQEEMAEAQKKMIESYRDIGRATLDMIRGVDNGFDRLLLAIQEKFLFKPAEDLLTKAAASIGNAVIAGWGGGANPTGFGGGFGRDPAAAQLGGGVHIANLNVQTPTDINTLSQFSNGMG